MFMPWEQTNKKAHPIPLAPRFWHSSIKGTWTKANEIPKNVNVNNQLIQKLSIISHQQTPEYTNSPMIMINQGIILQGTTAVIP